MIADANVKPRVTWGGWAVLMLGMACLTLVPARAEDEKPVPPVSPQESAAPFALTTFCCPATTSEDDNAPADSEAGEADQNQNSRAAETQYISNGFREKAKFGRGESFSLIGDLTSSRFWTEHPSLAIEQANAITKLNNLLSEARVNSWLADAEYLDGNPADYQDYVARSNVRRSETIDHAQCLVTLGLLTESQAALVIQRLLSGQRQLYSLYQENVQELLGMTESQKERLAHVEEDAREKNARLNWFSVDPQEQKKFKAKRAVIKQEIDAAAKKILTPEQQEKWSQLTAKRTLPAEPPELPALSKAEAARINIEELSPTFRVLANNGDIFRISAEQKKLLKDLKEVAQIGLFWISQRGGQQQTKPIAETRAKFIKHAEQVALLGILTQSQAEMVQGLVTLSSGC